jgi:hypothetical protein
MFERSLADLIRGLRGLGSPSQQDEAKFIAQAVDEIRQEIKSKDMELKTAAILKLTYVRRFFQIQFYSVGISTVSDTRNTYTARYVRVRHVLGFIPRRRSYVIPEVPS